MRVAERTVNLLYRLQQDDPTVESLVEATEFFGPKGLKSTGRRFAETVLPYFIYATNNMSEYINNEEVWNGFMSYLTENMVGIPWTSD
jgi:hypothetical protein